MADKKIIDAMWDDSPVDVSTEVNFIWSIANKLRGTYQSDKYKDVIIPMVIIRRFECALAPTKAKVVETYKANPNYPAKAMYRLSGFQFYNTSEFDLAELVNDSDHLAANFKAYIQGFSANIQDIIRSLDFDKQIDKMDKNNRLLSVVKAFSELDLDPHTIDNVKMGYIFEDLIRRFSENAEAGDHYTGRDIIKLMVNILLAEGCDDIFDDGKVITVLDQACGTGGMLSTSYNFIKRYNPSADVRLFGQEINPESYAICLAEMMIKGQNAENICYQDTMKSDRFKGTKMRFVIENPPFGTPWGGKDAAEGVEQAVQDEYKKGFDGRWGAGLPGSGDMQMLFLQSAIDKMDDHLGRAAIIENGSPLFSGGTASGESQIRSWMLENDLIEVIIALPTDLFYNTGIATYIWVLSKNKRPERKGKIQLIDASSFFKKLRKALGDKKNEISPEDRTAITKLYADFTENEYCKIYSNEEFIYREYVVMQPLQLSYAITAERIETMLSKGALSCLYDQAKVDELENAEELTGKELKKLEAYQNNQPVYEAILAALKDAVSEEVYLSPAAFMPVLTHVLANVTTDKKLLEKIADGLSMMDKAAEIQRDRKGNMLFDKETKDTEIVKWDENIEDYMAREVLPHIPDAVAFFEENLGAKKPVVKTGAEIPFTRYFYKYHQPVPSEELKAKFMELERSVSERVARLFDEAVTKGLEPDVEMKDSGIQWIGSMPAHWNCIRGKYVLKYIQKPVREDDGVITCFRDGEVTLRSNRREDGFTMADKEIGYQGIDVGDLVVHGMDGFAGAIGISDSRGKASPVLNVLDTEQSKRYIMYFLRSMAYSDVFLALATGIRVRSCDLRWNKLSELFYPVPPLEEQEAIVDYIDSVLRRTDEVITAKREQLSTLEAYKKSLIYEYVTGKKEVPHEG